MLEVLARQSDALTQLLAPASPDDLTRWLLPAEKRKLGALETKTPNDARTARLGKLMGCDDPICAAGDFIRGK